MLLDSWYSACENLKLVHALKKTFFTTLKSNRLVSLSKEEGYIHLDDIDWTPERLQFGVIVKLKKEASYLASKALDGPLTRRERIELWLHLAMCRLCRRYAKDIKSLRAILRRAGKSGIEMLPEQIKLSEQSRERIKHALNTALHHD